MARASSIGLPRTIASSAAGSRIAICCAVIVTGKLTVWPTTIASPTSTSTEPGTSWCPWSIAWLTAASAIALTGAESAATTVPVADSPRANDWTSWPTSVSGATVGVDWPRTPVAGKTVAPAGACDGSAIDSRNASWSDESRAAIAPSTSSCVTLVNASLRPPVVGSGLVTLRKSDDSLRGTTTIVLASTLPSGPPSTAVTLTLARAGKMVSPTSSARGTVTVTSVLNRMLFSVPTMLPDGIRFVLVGSRFSKRTVPVALVSCTRLPVAGKVSFTETGIVMFSAGTTGGSPPGAAAFGSATTVTWTGVIASGRGVTTILADGRRMYAPTAPTSMARARIAAPMSHGVRMRVPPRSLAPGRAGRGSGARVISRETGARTVALESAVAAAATPAAAIGLTSVGGLLRTGSSRSAGVTAAAGATAGPTPPAASYSATDAKTGSPADDASARVAGSADTIDSCFSCSVASRDRKRELIREVATREPYGRTTARRSC